MPTFDLSAIFSAATPEDRDSAATTWVSSVNAKDLVGAQRDLARAPDCLSAHTVAYPI